MNSSLKELKKFKEKLISVYNDSNQLYINLFLKLIEYLEKSFKIDYFCYLLHNPLDDLDDDDIKIYKNLIQKSNSQIINLNDIIEDIKDNNIENIEHKLKKIFNNAILTSDANSPLFNEHSNWFNKNSKSLYNKFLKMNELYKKSLVSNENLNYLELFSSELKINNQKTNKRQSEEVKDERKHKKLKKYNIQNIVLDIISDIDWNNFLDDKLELNKNSKNYIKTEISKKLEYNNLDDLQDKYIDKINNLNEQINKLNVILTKNKESYLELESIRNELNTLRQKTRSGINTSSKLFNDNYLKKQEDLENKSESLNKLYSEKLNMMENMFSKGTLKRDYSAIFNRAFKNISDIKIGFDTHFKKQVDNYKLQINSLHEQIDLLKNELSNKKSHIDIVFKEYEKIKDDIKKRVNSMTGFVGDFFCKMSAAANGLAITIDD